MNLVHRVHHHSPLPRSRWDAGGSDGGLSCRIRSKQGHVYRNAAASLGRRHTSKGGCSIGCSGHEMRCLLVRSVRRQHRQVGDGDRSIRCLKVLSAKQYPERSCACVVLVLLGRPTFSASTSGAADPRTPFKPLLANASRTVFVWIVILASLTSFTQPSTIS